MMRVRDPETGEWKLVEEMTYAEWAGWKKSQMGSKEIDIIIKKAHNES